MIEIDSGRRQTRFINKIQSAANFSLCQAKANQIAGTKPKWFAKNFTINSQADEFISHLAFSVSCHL